MANPKLSYKEDNVLNVNKNVKSLFKVIYQEINKEESDDLGAPKIKVSEFISKMSFYYEKLRNSVDYKEEYLLRKNAIMRILRRQIVIQGAVSIQDIKSRDIASHLLTELIRAGYLPNNKIPESKIDELAGIVEKYIRLKRAALSHQRKGNRKIEDLTKWIITMAACDIEERLGRNKIEQIVLSNLYETLTGIIKLHDDSPYNEDREIQIYISIHRSYLKFDRDLVSFILFKYYNSDWDKANEEYIEEVGRNIAPLSNAIERQIDHPLEKQLDKIIKRYTGFYSVLTDVIKEDPVGVYENFKSDPKAFSRDIKKICERKYKLAHKKLWRAAFRSMAYILITKSIFAAALEYPTIQWFGEEVNYFSLSVNILFPPMLLLIATALTKLPNADNTNKIIEGINEITFKELERKEPVFLRKTKKRGVLQNAFFGIFYAVTFFFSFGLIIWALDKIHFTWVSITIFLFFLAFVSFFNLRIRKGAHELIVIEKKDNIFTFLVDFFYMPIIAAGKWLSERFSRINVFVFFMDFIIEAPFKIFVEAAEEWTKYVKERKEEIM